MCYWERSFISSWTPCPVLLIQDAPSASCAPNVTFVRNFCLLLSYGERLLVSGHVAGNANTLGWLLSPLRPGAQTEVLETQGNQGKREGWSLREKSVYSRTLRPCGTAGD